MVIEVKKDCLCEHYLHELLNYYREGLIKKSFNVGEQFEVVEEWRNLYGKYYRVKVDGKTHDIDVNNCKIISR
jgi:hypothetical protein